MVEDTTSHPPAMGDAWYREHPAEKNPNHAVIQQGLRYTAKEFQIVKEDAARNWTKLLGPLESLRGNNAIRKAAVAERTIRILSLELREHVPQDWFNEAAVRIAQIAKTNKTRPTGSRSADKSGYQTGGATDDAGSQSGDATDDPKKRKREITPPADDHFGGKGLAGRKARMARKAQSAREHQRPPPKSIKRGDDHEAAMSTPGYSSTASYDPVPQQHGFASNPTPAFANVLDTSPPILVACKGQDGKELIEYCDILDDAQQPSFEKLKEVLIGYDAHYGQLEYKGVWNGMPLLIRTSAHLRRIMHDAKRNNLEYTNIEATCKATRPIIASSNYMPQDRPYSYSHPANQQSNQDWEDTSRRFGRDPRPYASSSHAYTPSYGDTHGMQDFDMDLGLGGNVPSTNTILGAVTRGNVPSITTMHGGQSHEFGQTPQSFGYKHQPSSRMSPATMSHMLVHRPSPTPSGAFPTIEEEPLLSQGLPSAAITDQITLPGGNAEEDTTSRIQTNHDAVSHVISGQDEQHQLADTDMDSANKLEGDASDQPEVMEDSQLHPTIQPSGHGTERLPTQAPEEEDHSGKGVEPGETPEGEDEEADEPTSEEDTEKNVDDDADGDFNPHSQSSTSNDDPGGDDDDDDEDDSDAGWEDTLGNNHEVLAPVDSDPSQPQVLRKGPTAAAALDDGLGPYQKGRMDQIQFDNKLAEIVKEVAEDKYKALYTDDGDGDGDSSGEGLVANAVAARMDNTLTGRLARMTPDVLHGTAAYFGLDVNLLLASTKLIPIDKRWLTKPGSAMFAHQWFAVYVMLELEARYGGGALADAPGAGKTWPALFKQYVNFFILRLRFQLRADRAAGNRTRHIITPAEKQGPDDQCPSQAHLPIPCTCKVGTWTFNHVIPEGIAVYITMPSIMNATLSAIHGLFDNAPIFSDPEFPLRIAIAHEETQRGHSKLAYTAKLTSAELGLMCRSRAPRGEFPTKCTHIVDETWPKGIPRPGGLDTPTLHRSSRQASRFLVVTTLQSLGSQLLNKTMVQVAYQYRRPLTPKEREEKPKLGKTISVPVTENTEYLVVIREVLNDECHNNYSFHNATMTLLRNYRLALYRTTNNRMRYWMTSGTVRYSGISVLASHLSSMLFRKSWLPKHPDNENGNLDEEKRSFLSQLDCTVHRRTGQAPVQRLIAEWNTLLRACSQNALSGDDVIIQKPTLTPKIIDMINKHVDNIAPIYKAFIIERGHDTLHMDGKPLMATADIMFESRLVKVAYSDDSAAYIQQLADVVSKEVAANLQRRYEVWEELGCHGAEPTAIKASRFKGYLNVIVASTTPGLVRWVQDHGAEHGLEGLKQDQPVLKKWWTDPLHCPFYTEFETIIQGDMKWKTLQALIDGVLCTPKSAHSGEGMKSKMLIGVNRPTVALLYFCGLLHRFKQKTASIKDYNLVREQTVTALHSGIPLSDRPLHYAAINDIEAPTRFLIAPALLVAEGLPITGVNHAVLVDPIPDLNKVVQFFGRPCRQPQKEKVIYSMQFYNSRSTYDKGLIVRQLASKGVQESVGETVDVEACGGKTVDLTTASNEDPTTTGDGDPTPAQRYDSDLVVSNKQDQEPAFYSSLVGGAQ